MDLEIIEETAQIVNEAMKERVQVNLIISNRAGSKASLIAEKIADPLRREKQQGFYGPKSFQQLLPVVSVKDLLQIYSLSIRNKYF